MTRLTKKADDGTYTVDSEQLAAAIQALARFENAYEGLVGSMSSIPLQLDKLRAEGREKTVTYRETMAQKLIDNHVHMFFARYGIT